MTPDTEGKGAEGRGAGRGNAVARAIPAGSHGRGRAWAEVSSGARLNISFVYLALTPDYMARVFVRLGAAAPRDATFQIDNLDTGWSSGRLPLRDGDSHELTLGKPGDNLFRIRVFNSSDRPIAMPRETLVITRGPRRVQPMPASRGIAIEARETWDGPSRCAFIVHPGDALPKRGQVTFKADEPLRPGERTSLKFKLWEGDFEVPTTDNHFIGMFEIAGSDLPHAMIVRGAELVVDYEVTDSGLVMLDVKVPAIKTAFRSGVFFSRQPGQAPGQIDDRDAARIVVAESRLLARRIDGMAAAVQDARLVEGYRHLTAAEADASEGDLHAIMPALDAIQRARETLAAAHAANRVAIRQSQWNRWTRYFERAARDDATPAEVAAVAAVAAEADAVIASDSGEFESHMRDFQDRVWRILWRQDWFVVDRLSWLARTSRLFPDRAQHRRWVDAGLDAMLAGDVVKLRQAVKALESVRLTLDGDERILTQANIVIG